MNKGQIHTYKITLLCLIPLSILLFLTTSCSPATQGQGEPSPTVTLQATEEQIPESPQPSATEAPSPSPTSTPVPTFTLTPTPYVLISSNTNCRVGPGTVYDWLYTYQIGDEVMILGKDAEEGFWYTSDQNGFIPDCWLWGKYTTPVGDTSSLPVFTPPPTPTPRPNFSVRYADYDGAGDDAWLWFKISNTGSGKWESVMVFTKNIDTDDLAVNISNTFKNSVSGSTDLPNIPPAKSGFISSGKLYKPFGYTIDVYIVACEKDNLGGLCQAERLSIDLTTP